MEVCRIKLVLINNIMVEGSEKSPDCNSTFKERLKLKIMSFEGRVKGIKRSETGVLEESLYGERIGGLELTTKRKTSLGILSQKGLKMRTSKNLARVIRQVGKVDNGIIDGSSGYMTEKNLRGLRIETPKFNEKEISEYEELKELCVLLKTEQELLKEEIFSQKKFLKQFQVKGERANSFIRAQTRRGSPLVERGLGETVLAKLDGIGKNESLSTSLVSSPKAGQDIRRLPFLFGPGSENKIKRTSSGKYSRDKPVLSKHFRAAKDVFILKNKE